MQSLSRRRFLVHTSAAATGPWLGWGAVLAGATSRRWRVVIIGSTGQGDFGHNLDIAFDGIDRVEVAALADPNEAGRNRAARRAKVEKTYADYLEMLAKERPELVVIAPRWSEQHFAMAKAALQSGAHVLTEKPFTVTLAEADELLATAKKANLKIAVAHQMGLHPAVVHLHEKVRDGLLGEILHLRSWGKQDARAGGEDLIVLGTHIFDMMRLFVGDAMWCSAQVWSQGHAITRNDARSASEKIGPVAGDEIEARFTWANRVTASFTSRGRLRETLGPWAVELQGSKGAARILMDIDPIVLIQRRRQESALPRVTEEWLPQRSDPSLDLSAEQRGFGPANRRVVLDWLDAIEHDREPQCNGENATKALEFVMATYESALNHAEVRLPLAKREHPLG